MPALAVPGGGRARSAEGAAERQREGNRIVARVQVLSRKRCETKTRNNGDHTGLNLQVGSKKAEDFSNDTPFRQNVGSRVTQLQASGTFGLKQYVPENQQLLLGGAAKAKLSQETMTGIEFAEATVQPGDILQLVYEPDEDEPTNLKVAFDAENLVATGWVEDEHYILLAAIGIVHINKLPAGITAFSADVSKAANAPKLGIASAMRLVSTGYRVEPRLAD